MDDPLKCSDDAFSSSFKEVHLNLIPLVSELSIVGAASAIINIKGKRGRKEGGRGEFFYEGRTFSSGQVELTFCHRISFFKRLEERYIGLGCVLILFMCQV